MNDLGLDNALEKGIYTMGSASRIRFDTEMGNESPPKKIMSLLFLHHLYQLYKMQYSTLRSNSLR